jgi:hypothetical protein
MSKGSGVAHRQEGTDAHLFLSVTPEPFDKRPSGIEPVTFLSIDTKSLLFLSSSPGIIMHAHCIRARVCFQSDLHPMLRLQSDDLRLQAAEPQV